LEQGQGKWLHAKASGCAFNFRHTLESHLVMQDCVMANLDAYFVGKPFLYAVHNA
jgi:hypothetical protein